MIKAAFFDIDGTLLSFETHRMPDSTKRALELLQQNGVSIIVASGRPLYQMPPSMRSGFDAYLTLNGQLCFDSEGVYRSVPIPRADADIVLGQVEDGLYDALVLQRERSFVNRLTPRVQATATKAGLVYEPGDLALAYEAPIYQFCIFVDPGEEGVFMDATTGLAQTRWTELFCDVVPAEGGKNYGVAATLERLGITPDEAIAFGDGGNDLSMFGAVGTSVAMGNAWDEVKEQASYVTSSVDDDGIYRACEHFGLI